MNIKQAAVFLANAGGDRRDLARDLRRQFPRLTVAWSLELVDEALATVAARDAELDRLANAEHDPPRKADFSEFDRFFDEGDYKDGDEPQAFADWLSSKTGKKVVGLSQDGAVEGRPSEEKRHERG